MTQLALGPKALAAGVRYATFDAIGSTNAEALARARGGECGPIWFVSTEQTAGRGRRDRTWIAPRGNLAASILEVMDITPGIAATLGKTAGKDAANDKPTYVSLLGLDQARAHADELCALAHAALARSGLSDTRALAALADMVVSRTH